MRLLKDYGLAEFRKHYKQDNFGVKDTLIKDVLPQLYNNPPSYLADY